MGQVKRYPSKDNISGDSASQVYALPSGQVAIVALDATVLDLIGVRANSGGDLYIRMEKDSTFTKNTVSAGETLIGRITGVGTSTTIADADLIGII